MHFLLLLYLNLMQLCHLQSGINSFLLSDTFFLVLSWTWVQKLVTYGHLSNRAQTHMDELERYNCADWEMSTPPSVDLVMWLPFCRKRYPGNLGLTVLDASQPRDHPQSFDLTAQNVTFSSSQSGRILHGHVCRQSQGCDGWVSLYIVAPRWLSVPPGH